MDLRTLRQFLHLAHSLHFGKTSEALHVSPSTLSRSISRLEDKVGVALFERDNRSVALTQAGRRFRSFAEDTLASWEDLKHDIRQAPTELTGQIRIYCTVTASYSFMPELLTRFRKSFPNIEVILETGDVAQALQQVADQEIDIAVAPLPDQLPNQMEFLSLLKTPLQFIGPTVDCPVSRLLDEIPVNWRQLPLVISEYGLTRKRLDQWLRSQGVKPRVYAQVAGHEAIVGMVGMGFGVGLVPQLVLENSPMKERIRVIPVQPQVRPFDVGLCTLHRRMQDPLVKAFWQIAQTTPIEPPGI
ncbi:HTH-type transcriptional activator IlvY [Gynuella sp.]|uniref:HTH-type transcriptional activator IlvY n=1 Tax=Gynuella sp. TaxID=2969146 RepID=UPI003D0C91E3